jgi:hypothetical protein
MRQPRVVGQPETWRATGIPSTVATTNRSHPVELDDAATHIDPPIGTVSLRRQPVPSGSQQARRLATVTEHPAHLVLHD